MKQVNKPAAEPEQAKSADKGASPSVMQSLAAICRELTDLDGKSAGAATAFIRTLAAAVVGEKPTARSAFYSDIVRVFESKARAGDFHGVSLSTNEKTGNVKIASQQWYNAKSVLGKALSAAPNSAAHKAVFEKNITFYRLHNLTADMKGQRKPSSKVKALKALRDTIKAVSDGNDSTFVAICNGLRDKIDMVLQEHMKIVAKAEQGIEQHNKSVKDTSSDQPAA